MDIYRLSTDIKFLNQIGMTLNIEERYKLKTPQKKKKTKTKKKKNEIITLNFKNKRNRKFRPSTLLGKNTRSQARLLHSNWSPLQRQIRIPF